MLKISSKTILKIAIRTLLNIPNEILSIRLNEFIQSPTQGYRFDPSLKNEANANDISLITLGYSFFDLDEQSRKHVIAHEKAHYLFDSIFKDNNKWDDLFKLVEEGAFGPKYPDGIYIDGINGQITPMENMVEALTVFAEEPEWLESKYPVVYNYIVSLF
jgi:hypothetical protein